MTRWLQRKVNGKYRRTTSRFALELDESALPKASASRGHAGAARRSHEVASVAAASSAHTCQTMSPWNIGSPSSIAVIQFPLRRANGAYRLKSYAGVKVCQSRDELREPEVLDKKLPSAAEVLEDQERSLERWL